ncbi:MULTISPECIES: cytochrome P450 [unclassified Nocardiopsis]|uniref:cytochrome P450 n=1 Tax=unclassified Nocardiopsis TaxID=2649073 RepID=UPI001359A67B|nr:MULTISPECIES: cytochrome P450 [unclassified Nocardiopsis]
MNDTPGLTEDAAPPSSGPPSPSSDHAEAVRFYGPDIARDPAGLYEDLRRRFGPVAPILLDGDVPAWFVLGYRELHHVTSRPEWFARDCRRWNQWDEIGEDWPLMPYVMWTPSVMFAEGAEHQRRAGAIGDALDAIDRVDFRDLCQQVADGLIDTFSAEGEADLVGQYAHRIPAGVIARLYGLPEREVPAMVADVLLSLDVTADAGGAHQRVYGRLEDLVADRRRAPRADLPSRLLLHPAGLTDAEVVIDLLVILAAAQAPTGNWIGNTLRLMLVDDQFSVVLQGGRSSSGEALNEVLWKDTPTQNFIGRWAVQACELGGRHIRRGDLLVLGLSAANADPRLHAGVFDIYGSNRAQMSFGHGEHGCPFPAPETAGIIARTAVESLLDRLPDVRLAVPPDRLRWRPSVWMRGLFDLPVRFTPGR